MRRKHRGLDRPRHTLTISLIALSLSLPIAVTPSRALIRILV